MEKVELLKRVRQIEIRTKKIVDELLSGNYRSVFKGRGIEFDSVKEYNFDDDVKNIDWNVTARSDKAFVKTYHEERELNVIIAVDYSASQRFGTSSIKHDICLEISALLAFSALKNKDKVGLLIFSDKIDLYIPPKNSKNHILRIIREIADDRETGAGTNINGAMTYLNRILKRHSIIFFISDFISDIDYQKPLKVASKKHDFIGLKLFDRLEQSIPDVGMIRFRDMETGSETVIDTSSKDFRDKYERTNERENAIIKDLFNSLNIDFLKFNTKDDYILKLIKFFKLRSKRY